PAAGDQLLPVRVFRDAYDSSTSRRPLAAYSKAPANLEVARMSSRQSAVRQRAEPELPLEQWQKKSSISPPRGELSAQSAKQDSTDPGDPGIIGCERVPPLCSERRFSRPNR